MNRVTWMPEGKVPQGEGPAGAKVLGLDTTWSCVELSCPLSEGGTVQHREKRRSPTPLTFQQAPLATVRRMDGKEARVEATDLIQVNAGGQP